MRRLGLLTAGTAVLYAIVSAPFLIGGELRRSAATSGPPATVALTGAWRTARAGLHDVSVDAAPPARLTIDGKLVAERTGDAPAAPRTIWLAAGYHAIAIDAAAGPVAFLQGSPGRALAPPSRGDLSSSVPQWPKVWSVLANLRGLVGVVLAILAVLLAASALRTWRSRTTAAAGIDPLKDSRRHRRDRALSIAALALIVIYGAMLRVDAITSTYGAVERPHIVRAVQDRLHSALPAITPAGWHFDPAPTYAHADGPPTRYRSDPYTYLEFAREMRWFYAAHYREPVFPFATRMWLRALANQDVAVSFTSMMFSVIAIVMTYLVASLMFGRAAGLAAAALLAIERDVVRWDIAGWRDTAFMCAVLVVVHALLRAWRSPTTANAIWIGVAGGIACLVRITSISFVGPALAMLLLVPALPRRQRGAPFAIALVALLLVVAPYLFNCWRVYGDPLYSINVHTSVYQATEGSAPADVGALSYVRSKLRMRPFQTLETGVYGLTAYPFLNKWRGFDVWWPSLGTILSWLAIPGLLAWAYSRDGRMLLIVLFTSLLPFAFTWTLIADWRFTEHAYPFLLVAACGAIALVVKLLFVPRPAPLTRADRRLIVAGTSIAAGVVILALAFTYGMPPLVAREALAAGEDVSLTTGARDAAIFRSGWSEVFGSGNVTMRVMTGDTAVIAIPLADAGDYAFTLRADPFPVPATPLPSEQVPSLALSINGVSLLPISLHVTPGRVGSYRVTLPRTAIRRGENRLELRFVPAVTSPPGAVRGMTDASTAAVWYVRVHPS